MLAGVNHFLGKKLSCKHSCDQYDIKIWQNIHPLFFISEDGRVCDNGAIRYHKKGHINQKRVCRFIESVPDRKAFPFDFRIFDPAKKQSCQSTQRENKYAYKGCLRMHIILHLNSDKRPQSHTNRYGKSESVNSRSDHIPWQQIAGQSHSCRAAHRVNRAHI